MSSRGCFSPQRRARPRAQRPATPPPVSVPDEIVVVEVDGAALDQLGADGFTILARTPLSLVQGEIARLTAPQGMDFDTARTNILAVAPAAIVDQNHLYRSVEMPCRPGNCPAFEMIGWAVPPASCGLAATIGMIDTVVNREHEALREQGVEVISVMTEGDREVVSRPRYGDRGPARRRRGEPDAGTSSERQTHRRRGIPPRRRE